MGTEGRHAAMLVDERAQGGYFACEQPERPWDEFACYDTDCAQCMAAAALHTAFGHGEVACWPVNNPSAVTTIAALPTMKGTAHARVH